MLSGVSMKISTDVVNSKDNNKRKNDKKRKRDNTSGFIMKWAKKEE